VPIINLSLVDLCFLNARDTAFDEINPIMNLRGDADLGLQQLDAGQNRGTEGREASRSAEPA
jgi:hypothetical protein